MLAHWSSIFSGIAQVHLRRFAALATEEEHGLGTTLFAEGDAGTKLYLVLGGAVRVSRMVRDPDKYKAIIGEHEYEEELANCLYGVYQMLGKLCPMMYVLER